jgi:hypothetical protein
MNYDKHKKLNLQKRSNLSKDKKSKEGINIVKIKEEIFLSDTESNKLNKKKVKLFTQKSVKIKEPFSGRKASLNSSFHSSAKSTKSNLTEKINFNETSCFLKKNLAKNKDNFKCKNDRTSKVIENNFKKQNKKFVKETKTLNIKIKNKKTDQDQDPILMFLSESCSQTFDKMNIYFLSKELEDLINENTNNQDIQNDTLANLEALKETNNLKKKEIDNKFLEIEEELKKTKIDEQIILNELDNMEEEVFIIKLNKFCFTLFIYISIEN